MEQREDHADGEVIQTDAGLRLVQPCQSEEMCQEPMEQRDQAPGQEVIKADGGLELYRRNLAEVSLPATSSSFWGGVNERI